MTDSPENILKQATLFSDEQVYTFVKLSPSAVTAAAGLIASIAEPFCALIVDRNEVSLMIPAEAWADFQQRFVDSVVSETPYRLITFDIVLEPDLIGFMAYISQALADAEISILPYAAFSRDHLFVQTDQFESAMSALKRLQDS